MKILIMFGAILVAGTAMAQSTAPSANPALPADNRTQFEGLDINRDGRLSPAEASGVAPFNNADKNGNGSLDRLEYTQHLGSAGTSNIRAPAYTPPSPAPRPADPAMPGASSSSSSSRMPTMAPPITPTPGTNSMPGTVPPAHGSAPPSPLPGDRATPATSPVPPPPPPPGAPPSPRP